MVVLKWESLKMLARQKPQVKGSSTVTWAHGKDWGKGVGIGDYHMAPCPDFENPEDCES